MNTPPGQATPKHSTLSCISYTIKASPLILYEALCFFQREGRSKLREAIMGSWTIIIKYSHFIKILSTLFYKPWSLAFFSTWPFGVWMIWLQQFSERPKSSDDLLNISEISCHLLATPPPPYSSELYENYGMIYRPGLEGQDRETLTCPGMAQLSQLASADQQDKP